MIHGKAGTYTARGCRCDACRAAHKVYSRRYRENNIQRSRKYYAENRERHIAYVRARQKKQHSLGEVEEMGEIIQ